MASACSWIMDGAGTIMKVVNQELYVLNKVCNAVTGRKLETAEDAAVVTGKVLARGHDERRRLNFGGALM